MSTRKNSDKAPKPKKEKKEKAPKTPKASKSKKSSKKKGKGADVEDAPIANDDFVSSGVASDSFDNDSAPIEPVAAAKPKKTKVKKQKQPHPKAPTDVYTLLLLLGFIFFIAASVFMYLDVSSYK
ncbi:MAG: hypothetical protein Q4G03_07655 [Planctomycetia bacterium]|nr:hypothetical protein [Planctomycetia bacterium]